MSTIRTAPCPAVKSFVFLFLGFVSLFSLHAVAKHVIEANFPFTDGDSLESSIEVATVAPAQTGAEQEASTADAEFTVSKATTDSAAEKESRTLWNPLSKTYLTREQVALLELAFDVGYQDGGLQQAKLLQATMMQETIAGLLGRIGHLSAPVGKRSYGVMQVKVSAATDVLRRHPEMGEFKSEEELIAQLITDDRFNIAVASKQLLHLRKSARDDAQALLAYNIGLRASKRYKNHASFSYVKGVRRFYSQVIVPFNEKYRSDYKLASSV